MAHEITITKGVAEMAFVGNRSEIWHGLGQELTRGAPIETWQREAGMNWVINSSPASFTNQTGETAVFKGKQILYRNDTGEELSIVGDKYKIVQPQEVLEFFRSLVSDAGMELSTAGTLFGGRKFWALADTKQSVVLNKGKDRVNGFLLLSTACDGTMSTSAQFTSVRVVCNNTLNIALNSHATKVSTSHKSTFNPNNVKMELGLYESAWEKFSNTLTAMTQVKVSQKDAYNDLLALFAYDPADPTTAEIRTVNTVQGLYAGNGMGADVAGQTVFGLLNAITEYHDHHIGRNPNRQLDSTFWGPANKNKNQAFDYLTNTYDVATV